MAKTAIEQLQTVLELGAEALEAYVNPIYGGGINANAAGGIFSNLISRHGINAETLRDLMATLQPIGVLLQDDMTETAAVATLDAIRERFPKLFAEMECAHQVEDAGAQFAIPVMDGAKAFTDKHVLVSALVDTETLLNVVENEEHGPEPSDWAELSETVQQALDVSDEVKAIAQEMREAITLDLDELDEDEQAAIIAAAQDNAPLMEQVKASHAEEGGSIPEGGRTIVGDNSPPAPTTSIENVTFSNPPEGFNPIGAQTGRLPRGPNRSNTPRQSSNSRSRGKGRGR